MKQINGKQLAIGIFLIIGYMLIIPLIIVFILRLFPISENTYFLLANSLTYLLSFIILVWYYHESLQKEWLDFWHNKKEYLKNAGYTWLVSVLFMVISNMIIVALLNTIPQNEEVNRSIITSYPIFSVIAMIFLGPFLEEVLFRKGLKNAFQNPKIFYLVSGLLFGGAHILAALNFDSWTSFLNCLPECLYLITYGGIGYIYAQAYQKTNNIFVSTTAHMIQNTLSIILIFIGGSFL